MDKADIAAGATYGGAGASLVLFGLQINEWAAVVGAIVAVVGLCAQLYYLAQKNDRAKELHRAALEGYRNGGKATYEGAALGDGEGV